MFSNFHYYDINHVIHSLAGSSFKESPKESVSSKSASLAPVQEQPSCSFEVGK